VGATFLGSYEVTMTVLGPDKKQTSPQVGCACVHIYMCMYIHTNIYMVGICVCVLCVHVFFWSIL